MWKAEKIELIPNSLTADRNTFYFEDCFTLKINEVLISNCINEKLTIYSPSEFQDHVCTFCGVSCDSGGYLSMYRQGNSLLVIPCFSEMDSFLERDGNDPDENYGEWYCPPHKWYESGILKIDDVMLPIFLKTLPGFDLERIPFITEDLIEIIAEWEKCVIEKPKDFMR